MGVSLQYLVEQIRQESLVPQQPFFAEIADNERHHRRLQSAVQRRRVYKPFPAGSVFGAEGIFWKPGNEFGSDFQGVFHFSFGKARVGAYPVDSDVDGIGAEGLVFYGAFFLPVHCIAVVGA